MKKNIDGIHFRVIQEFIDSFGAFKTNEGQSVADMLERRLPLESSPNVAGRALGSFRVVGTTQHTDPQSSGQSMGDSERLAGGLILI